MLTTQFVAQNTALLFMLTASFITSKSFAVSKECFSSL
jgi:hypothetical protein